MLHIFKKKVRRRILRARNSIGGGAIQDNTIDDDDIEQEAIQYYHLAPNLASLLDTIRSGLATLLGNTPLNTRPRNPTYSKTSTAIIIAWDHPTNSYSAGTVDFTTTLTLSSGQNIYYVDSYELRYRPTGTIQWTNVIDISSSTTHTITANPFVAHEVEIRGRNDALGPSEWTTLSVPSELSITLSFLNTSTVPVTITLGTVPYTIPIGTTTLSPFNITSRTFSITFTITNQNHSYYVNSSNNFYIYPNYFGFGTGGLANITIGSSLPQSFVINITAPPLLIARIDTTFSGSLTTVPDVYLTQFINSLEVPILLNTGFHYFAVVPSSTNPIQITGTVPSSSVLGYNVSTSTAFPNYSGGSQSSTMGSFSPTNTIQTWTNSINNFVPTPTNFTMFDISLNISRATSITANVTAGNFTFSNSNLRVTNINGNSADIALSEGENSIGRYNSSTNIVSITVNGNDSIGFTLSFTDGYNMPLIGTQSYSANTVTHTISFSLANLNIAINEANLISINTSTNSSESKDHVNFLINSYGGSQISIGNFNSNVNSRTIVHVPSRNLVFEGTMRLGCRLSIIFIFIVSQVIAVTYTDTATHTIFSFTLPFYGTVNVEFLVNRALTFSFTQSVLTAANPIINTVNGIQVTRSNNNFVVNVPINNVTSTVTVTGSNNNSTELTLRNLNLSPANFTSSVDTGQLIDFVCTLPVTNTISATNIIITHTPRNYYYKIYPLYGQNITEVSELRAELYTPSQANYTITVTATQVTSDNWEVYNSTINSWSSLPIAVTTRSNSPGHSQNIRIRPLHTLQYVSLPNGTYSQMMVGRGNHNLPLNISMTQDTTSIVPARVHIADVISYSGSSINYITTTAQSGEAVLIRPIGIPSNDNYNFSASNVSRNYTLSTSSYFTGPYSHATFWRVNSTHDISFVIQSGLSLSHPVTISDLYISAPSSGILSTTSTMRVLIENILEPVYVRVLTILKPWYLEVTNSPNQSSFNGTQTLNILVKSSIPRSTSIQIKIISAVVTFNNTSLNSISYISPGQTFPIIRNVIPDNITSADIITLSPPNTFTDNGYLTILYEIDTDANARQYSERILLLNNIQTTVNLTTPNATQLSNIIRNSNIRIKAINNVPQTGGVLSSSTNQISINVDTRTLYQRITFSVKNSHQISNPTIKINNGNYRTDYIFESYYNSITNFSVTLNVTIIPLERYLLISPITGGTELRQGQRLMVELKSETGLSGTKTLFLTSSRPGAQIYDHINTGSFINLPGSMQLTYGGYNSTQGANNYTGTGLIEALSNASIPFDLGVSTVFGDGSTTSPIENIINEVAPATHPQKTIIVKFTDPLIFVISTIASGTPRNVSPGIYTESVLTPTNLFNVVANVPAAYDISINGIFGFNALGVTGFNVTYNRQRLLSSPTSRFYISNITRCDYSIYDSLAEIEFFLVPKQYALVLTSTNVPAGSPISQNGRPTTYALRIESVSGLQLNNVRIISFKKYAAMTIYYSRGSLVHEVPVVNTNSDTPFSDQWDEYGINEAGGTIPTQARNREGIIEILWSHRVAGVTINHTDTFSN
jgi:hypothetical protein